MFFTYRPAYLNEPLFFEGKNIDTTLQFFTYLPITRPASWTTVLGWNPRALWLPRWQNWRTKNGGWKMEESEDNISLTQWNWRHKRCLFIIHLLFALCHNIGNNQNGQAWRTYIELGGVLVFCCYNTNEADNTVFLFLILSLSLSQNSRMQRTIDAFWKRLNRQVKVFFLFRANFFLSQLALLIFVLSEIRA